MVYYNSDNILVRNMEQSDIQIIANEEIAQDRHAAAEKYEEVKNLPMRDILLRKVSGYEFYNTSKYTFEKLLDDPDNIEENLHNYLNGFSENVKNLVYLILKYPDKVGNN